MASSIIAGAMFAAPQLAAAQDSTEVEELVITGSRIARPEIESLQPVTTTSEQQIDNSGAINLGNVLRLTPQFTAYDQTTGDRASGNTGDVGVTFANLYGLGSQRTLTLINGKRVVGAASASGGGSNGLQVDLSAIPTGLVSRIETISVGGAPVYGSDAIAGTVNVILKDDFDGLEIEGQYGLTEENDGGAGRAQVLFGHNFAEGRGNVVVAAGYSKQDAITAEDRDFDLPLGFLGSLNNPQLNVPVIGGGFVFSSKFGRPSAFFGLGGLNPTTGAPQFFYTDAQGRPLTFDASGNLAPFNPGTPAGAVAAGVALVTYLPGSDEDTTRQMADVIQPSERIYLNGLGRFDLTSNLRAWTRFSYTQTEAEFGGIAPSANVLGATLATGPQQYSTANPFLTPATRAFFTANPQMGSTSFFLNKEYSEVTDGSVKIDQDTWTFQAGLEGDFDFVGRQVNWDLTYSRGRTTRSNISDNIITARLLFAQDAVYANAASTAVLPTPAGLDAANFTYDPAANVYREAGTGNLITCRVRVAGAAPAGANATDVSECAPFNPFGARNPQDAKNYLLGQQFQRSEIEQSYLQGNIGADLFDLPAGPLQVSAGFEIRSEDAEYNLDGGTKTGIFLGGGTGVAVKGGFDTKEFYAETRVPLVDGDMTQNALGFRLIEKLEFEGAIRWMDNSQAGEDVTWTAGGRLQITPDLMVRGNKTKAVRQPAVAELFSGVEPRFTSVTDPCAVGVIDTGPNPSGRRANCVQAVVNAGLAPNAAAATTFLSTFTTPLGGIAGTFAGNPDLASEEADSWTAGVVLTPRFLPGFTASIDWIDIEIDNVITALAGGSVAANCYDEPSGLANPYCAAITRGAGFRIVSFQSFYDNVARREFAGLTANARYSFEPGALFGQGDWGQLTLNANVFHLGHDRSGTVGLTDNTGGVGSEKWRAQAGFNWQYKDFGVFWQTNWYDKAKVDPNGDAIFLFNDVKEYYLSDASISWQVTPAARVQFIVNNVFDAEPPFNSFSYQYDRIGRRYQAGFNLRF